MPYRTIIAATLAASMGAPVAASPLADALADDGRFRAFTAALDDAGLTDLFEAGDGGTVFAPTDEAFRRIPEDLLERFGAPGAEDVLRSVVGVHLVPSGAYPSDNLPVEMDPLAPAARIVVTSTAGALTLRAAPPDDNASAEAAVTARAVAEARVRAGDIRIDDMIVHAIDRVLLPPRLKTMLAEAEQAHALSLPEAPQAAEAPESIAAQIADTDDGATSGIVPEAGDITNLAPAPRPARADGLGTTTSASSTAGNAEVFTYAPQSDTTASAPDLTGDAAPRLTDEIAVQAAKPPGEIVTLPASGPQTPRDSVSDARATASQSPAPQSPTPQSPEPEIALTADIVSVTDLLGTAVRDSEGTDLGQVVDVLIGLDGADAQTLVYAREGGVLRELGLGTPPERTRIDMNRVAIDPLDGAVVVSGNKG